MPINLQSDSQPFDGWPKLCYGPTFPEDKQHRRLVGRRMTSLSPSYSRGVCQVIAGDFEAFPRVGSLLQNGNFGRDKITLTQTVDGTHWKDRPQNTD
ncbi:hypothetical protein AVEN_193454-1 [Araneus ventricosus]|uniref:Uncharacterized protein n=1 Tax=Araneus ventricosus TaxID=182803 RepID=A0A4Y2TNS8_ARAVE|nr:hypothetical protein AVEN_193454-1 [Araneus ventricosus]